MAAIAALFKNEWPGCEFAFALILAMLLAMQKAILLVAYSAAGKEAKASLRGFETVCRERFPGWVVRWAFTSCLGRERLATQRQKSDSVAKALMRLGYEGFNHIAIQPLQTIAGCEYGQVRDAINLAREGNKAMRCALGLPLLNAEQQLGAVAAALLSHLPSGRLPGENVIFMGHGARCQAGEIYADFARAVYALDADVHIGTMHTVCSLDCILPRLKPGPVWLFPLLSTIGQHALRDMAGSAPESWRSRIEAASHECRPVLAGMADCGALRDIWLNNLAGAMAALP